MIRRPKTLNRNLSRYVICIIAAIFLLIMANYLMIVDSEQWSDNKLRSVDKRQAINENTLPSHVIKSSKKKIEIRGISSKPSVSLYIDDILVYEKRKENERGIHLIVINDFNGDVIETKAFDTCGIINMEQYMSVYLRDMRPDTILIFLVKDDAALSLTKIGRDALRSLGSTKIDSLKFRGYWAFISRAGKSIFEVLNNGPLKNNHGKPINVKITITLKDISTFCHYGNTSSSLIEKKRREFCFRYVGFHSLCNCSNPSPIVFKSKELVNNRMASVPISIVASNRPHYLFLMLRKLLTTQGVTRDMITVYIDGFYDQVVALLDLFNIEFVEHSRTDCHVECQIHQSYKHMLDDTTAKNPNAEFIMILEEDLLVADDLIDYFSQLLPLLSSDKSLYCISAWNDNSFRHSTNDSGMVYRVETMPGLGWVLKRDLYVSELASKWPTIGYTGDWDLWMRTPAVRKGRECLVPDISRTYHFGKLGSHLTQYETKDQPNLVLTTALNKKTGNKFNVEELTENGYEKVVNEMIKNAEVLDHSKDPCNNETTIIPNTKNHIYVLYIKWGFKGDAETWLNLATCFHLWDRDVRGVHKHMWRFWLKENHIFVVSSSSPYYRYKPTEIEPIFISNSRLGKTAKFDMSFRQGFEI